MRIHFTWDSGPYGLYYETNAGDPQGKEVPEEVWLRYGKAIAELREAEDALNAYS